MKNRQTRTKKIALLGLASSLTLLLSYVEFLLPPIFVAVPGIKVGLPNVIVLYVLYCLDVKYAALVSFTRLCISSILFGNAMTFAYSVAGAVLSLLVMGVLKKIDKLSAVGVSVAGGVAHNLGQVLVAMVLLDTPQIAFYMIVLAVTGTISGIFIGLCGALLVKRIPTNQLLRFK
ncbi:MAG: Gx transporter family protein [Clostridia bacterium]|nr:Gx transporter family protein [Clostridia bacterium]